MNKLRNVFLILTTFFVSVLSGYATEARVSMGSGTDEFNLGVGNYDYLPYRADNRNPIQLRTVLNDYGEWVSDSKFGQVWRPDAAADWKPFTNGHWVTTQSGQTWQGYEPWSWAADHYGHWILSQNHGWVWVSGNTYSPGRVAWSYGQDSIGWTPTPPTGYDYSEGYLGYRGANNQYSFNDTGFGLNFNFSSQDHRHQPLFSNSGYQGMASKLWIFVGRDRFLNDNYGGSYLSPVRVRDLFHRDALYISGRPLRREHLEKILGRRVQVVPVRYRDITIGRQRTRFAIPVGEEDHLRKHSRSVVDRVLAPGFAKRNKTFVVKSVGRDKNTTVRMVKAKKGTGVGKEKVQIKKDKKAKQKIHSKAKTSKEKHKRIDR